jgi:hypothetical protein
MTNIVTTTKITKWDTRARAILGPHSSYAEAFAARAACRAMQWATGLISLHDAVDDLQAQAERDGFVAAIGQDEVQRIMATTFAEARDNEAIRKIAHIAGVPRKVARAAYELKMAGHEDLCEQVRLGQIDLDEALQRVGQSPK